jgi:hypothetical protein
MLTRRKLAVKRIAKNPARLLSSHSLNGVHEGVRKVLVSPRIFPRRLSCPLETTSCTEVLMDWTLSG